VVYEPRMRSRSSLEATVYLIFEAAPLEHPQLCAPLQELIYMPLAARATQREPRPLHEWNLDKVEEQLKVLATGHDGVADAAETALERLHAFRY